ncbi:hypothetical protein DMB91_04400 [Campylobacter sp. MIT 97-5078]|uniref:SGNH/GDSL hydrolase family protein n=1 Tax=Campylobacter sp. MIT 97-5078 TaxID=1548153 RepID=UPI00116065E1|nr:SGNH/GDSL hydrolase family protein [Campylobacter sp. MIT 97-5078]TQR27243.1 hypothetical protein DMB91_04400 [Campylobacter sp. MIT 97-5078]
MILGGGGLEFYNLALGGSTALQNLYEIIRHKELLKNTELIITESNVNELHEVFVHCDLSISNIYRDICWLYKHLASLNKKILVLYLAEYFIKDNSPHNTINYIHKKLCLEYGLNFVDMRKYFEKHHLEEFGRRFDGGIHQFEFIMRELGKNIIQSIQNFKLPKTDFCNDNPSFKICTPKDMKIICGELIKTNMKNSMYDEDIYRINSNTRLKFTQQFNNCTLLGIHSWNNASQWKEKFNPPANWNECLYIYSSLAFYNKIQTITKEASFLKQFINLNLNFKIDYPTFIGINKNNSSFKEKNVHVITWSDKSKQINFCDIIAFFLAKNDGNFHQEQIDFNALAEKDTQIPKEYNFDHLIPPIELYKEIIDEYCIRTDPIKLTPLQNQINELKRFNENLNLAKARVHKHLAYKLGLALIISSKSLLGYLRMPFILSYTKAQHSFELKKYQNAIAKNPNLKLPPLENYPDYKEALQEKQCLTYKLGLALMQADKTWYKGGYVKFYFESKRLKREFKNKV